MAGREECRGSLAAALLPVLLHRINNTTQLVAGLNSLLALEGDEAVLETRADTLAAVSDSALELGWLFGVLASSLGADLLLERHERGGLAPLMAKVREALRREGRDLELAPAPGLALAPRSAGAPGWRVAWALAELAWTAGCALPRGETLQLEIAEGAAGHELSGRGGAGPELESLAAELARRLPGSRFEREGSTWSFAPPGRWLEELRR